ncbi:hypothetical protein BGX28_001683 [Mortierella sp. GBA30]|nr:hypothetical protein BGX28_001683 [Mortierella sp. GBA30]
MVSFLKGYKDLTFPLEWLKNVLPENDRAELNDSFKVHEMIKFGDPAKIVIDYLQRELDVKDTLHEATGGQNMFNLFNAFDGADLRRLESFLRKKDNERILGNLWRVVSSGSANSKDKPALLKRPNIKIPLQHRKYQPLQALSQNPRLNSFRLLGASRFGVRTDAVLNDTTSNLRSLHFGVRFVIKHDQEVLKSIIQSCRHLADLRLGGVYASEMHKELGETTESLAHLRMLRFYGMEKREDGGPIFDTFRRVKESNCLLRELVLVNCQFDELEVAELVKKSEKTLEALVLDHPTLQPRPLTTFVPAACDDSLQEYQLLRNLISLHLPYRRMSILSVSWPNLLSSYR